MYMLVTNWRKNPKDEGSVGAFSHLYLYYCRTVRKAEHYLSLTDLRHPEAKCFDHKDTGETVTEWTVKSSIRMSDYKQLFLSEWIKS